ncbi:MAG: undecaprenyldiphospho-muramoylpentapeptide beta-N-acetylglucosaminyltransferase [Candidatus Wildermuthbacteria bacterium]|nr:undecaprenyldiphospho-muramoylpentapeptide beta-N-acetylglucosaminyltransferase [Candidatus Wildermuthbacteria bacterium]
MKILFTGGGTGGHIIPLIAVIRELHKTQENKNLKLFYMGPKDDFGGLLLSQEGIQMLNIMAGKMRRYFSPIAILQNILDLCFRIPLGFAQAFFRIFFLAPDVILSKGGYGAIPATLAGWILRIPIFLHESDMIPGKANQIAAHFALKIFTSFPHTQLLPLKKVLLVGNPVRREILTGSKQEAKEIFKLKGDRPLLLVLGGSQGAQKINDAILSVINELTESFEIIHQTGEKNFQQVQAEANAMFIPENKQYYHASPFLKEPELRHAYAASNMIVARAGSGLIFEIAALGKPSILVPLMGSAQNHQFRNAYAYQDAKACIVLEEANLTPHFFLEKLKSLISNPKELELMSRSALAFAKPEAAKTIADYLVAYLED